MRKMKLRNGTVTNRTRDLSSESLVKSGLIITTLLDLISIDDYTRRTSLMSMIKIKGVNIIYVQHFVLRCELNEQSG